MSKGACHVIAKSEKITAKQKKTFKASRNKKFENSTNTR